MTKDNKLVTKRNDTEAETLLAVLQEPTYQKAAERLNITYKTLWERMNKYGIREKVAEIPKQALERLQIGSVKAANTLTDKLDSPRESMQAATEILDRVGLTGKQNQQNMQVNVQGNISDIEFVTQKELDAAESSTT